MSNEQPQHSPTLAAPRPRRRRWAVVSLVAALLAAGLAWYLVRRSTAPPPPPNPELNASEPAVAKAVQAARARVLKEPRSGEAWGELGKVFLANEMEDASQVCFTQAQRLDPKNPRW